jgi:elongation factor 1-alpha
MDENICCPNFPPEDDQGSTEYKLNLAHLSKSQMEHRITQLQSRLADKSDNGQAIYRIGVLDDGFPVGLNDAEMKASLDNLETIVSRIPNVKIGSIEMFRVTHYADSEEDLNESLISNPEFKSINRGLGLSDPDELRKIALMRRDLSLANKDAGKPGWTRQIAEVIIRKCYGDHYEIRIGIAGNVDAGKSTLLGSLISGELDNGRGKTRMAVAIHPHEVESGRTSSVAQHIMGFNGSGESVNDKLAQGAHSTGKLSWPDIVKDSNKIITFFDLAGHLKYYKGAVKGLSSNRLNYVLLVVSANLSVVAKTDTNGKKWANMTREHYQSVCSLDIPRAIVVTKIDSVPDNVRRATLSGVSRLIKERHVPFPVDNQEQVYTCIRNMEHGNIVPIFQISNVTGEGHDLLKRFLNLLPEQNTYVNECPPIMQIQDVFRNVPGVSTVISGILRQGTVFIPQGKKVCHLKIGPLSDGTFMETRVRSIEVKKVSCEEAHAGRYITIGLPKNDEINSRIRRGMAAIGAELRPKATWEFWTRMSLTQQSSNCARVGYTPFCNIGHVSQSCEILEIYADKGENHDDFKPCDENRLETLGTGDKAYILMRFCYRPEFIIMDSDDNDPFQGQCKILFRENRLRGSGYVFAITDTIHERLENRYVTKKHKTRPSRRDYHNRSHSNPYKPDKNKESAQL